MMNDNETQSPLQPDEHLRESVPAEIASSEEESDVSPLVDELADAAELEFELLQTTAEALSNDTTLAETEAAETTSLEALVSQIDEQMDSKPLDAHAFEDQTKGGLRDSKNDHIVFSLAGARYAVAIGQVIELDNIPPVTPVPNVPEYVLGVTNIRGEIISVLDLRRFLGFESNEQLRRAKILIVQARGEEFTGGLIVDEVHGIASVDPDRIADPPGPVKDRVVPLLRGVYEHDGRLLKVLDLERLFASAEIQELVEA